MLDRMMSRAMSMDVGRPNSLLVKKIRISVQNTCRLSLGLDIFIAECLKLNMKRPSVLVKASLQICLHQFLAQRELIFLVTYLLLRAMPISGALIREPQEKQIIWSRLVAALTSS